ncbi:MAG: anaerobic carbon-monoxide dehydrogenase catalytic subunit, partial [Lachnospiraceae bacterium]|nr:anaerobic carbon-monoxide dehydrogenase catalytic subunit [Lachnospiraceae bacterium]
MPSEEVIAATEELLKTAEKVGADTWQQRVRNQTPHCGFGESGTCCRICSMGPCRISKKAPRGICGCDVHGIVARNYLRFTAGGAATHSDHGRSIAHTLYKSSPESDYKVKDEEKLLRIAKEWEIETEGRDIYDVAHDVALAGLNEYGKPFGTQRFLKRAPLLRQQIWESQDISPRAIDREVSQSMHMTHMGCSSDPEALVRQALRAGLSDGWGGSMMGTEFSDILFGTPKPIDTEANIGVMEEDMVNIIVHGHDPSLSEMIVFYANDPEMIALAKEQGAKGINIAGVCCTSNEVAMRHGIPMAGNFLAQENVVLTGACEAIVVDVQCIFPALGPLSKCFHTKFITTSHIAKIPDSEFIEFDEANAGENAKKIIRLAIMNFKNRDPELVNIPKQKSKATVGYSVEAIKKCLDGVTNSHVDELGTMKPLVDAVKSGVIRGAVAMVGCNNPKIRPDSFHVDLMKRLLENDILVVVSGCSAQAAAKVGLMDKEAAKYCGEGLKRVCRLVDIPPVLH